MTIKKSGIGASKATEDPEMIWLNVSETANSLRELIRSMSMNAEEKIAVEDSINNLAREVESMLDRIGMAPAKEDRKKLLNAYRKFLEHNIEVVNQRLNEIVR
jgi:uncharacterized protein YdiU (UPF0061 family)